MSSTTAIRPRQRIRELVRFGYRKSETVLSVGDRRQERQRRIVLSAIASAVAKLISVATMLVSVPLTLSYLGTERYGMWMTMSSFIAMMSFADFGMGNGIMNAVAGAYGRDDRLAIRGYASTGLLVLTLIGLLFAVAFSVAYKFVPWASLFNVSTASAQKAAGPSFAVLCGCFALALPLGVVQRVQVGLQLSFAVSLWQAFGSILALFGVLCSIHLKLDLPWLILAFSGSPLIASIINTLLFFWFKDRDLRPAFNFVSRPLIATIARSGMLFFALQLIVGLAFASDNIIISRVLGASAVADYAVPQRLFNVIGLVLTMVLSPLWPAYGEAIARGDVHWVKRTLVQSLLAAGGFSAVCSIGLVFLSPLIIPLWVGDQIHPGIALLIGLGIWKVIESVCNALAMFLNGANLILVQVIAGSIGVLIGLPLKLFLVQEIGVSGAVFGLSASYILVCIPILILYMMKMFSRLNSTLASDRAC